MINVFVSAFSFSFINTDTSDDVSLSFEDLNKLIERAPQYNKIKVTKDVLEYKIDGETIDDILFEISNFSDQEYTVHLDELEKIISSFKSALGTDEVTGYSTLGLSYQGDFVAFYDQKNRWENIFDELRISNESELFDLNYSNLGLFPISNISFSKRSQLMFSNIDFHSDFEKTLLTVKNGDFQVYSIEFARALRALHDSVPKLSVNGHNTPDFLVISSECAQLGRNMSCTFQGKKKKDLKYDFEIKGKDEKVHYFKRLNCEFHLKINYDNNGRLIKEKHKGLPMYNRAYFGMPLLEGEKRIALAHLGCHYEGK